MNHKNQTLNGPNYLNGVESGDFGGTSEEFRVTVPGLDRGFTHDATHLY